MNIQQPKAATIQSVLGDMTDDDLLALVERAKTDQHELQKLSELQKKVFEAVERIIHSTIAVITQDEVKQETGMQAVSVAALTSAARQRASYGKQKRALAEDMVVGYLINRDNPDWNPLDPSTSRKSEKNGLLSLMQFGPQDFSPANATAT